MTGFLIDEEYAEVVTEGFTHGSDHHPELYRKASITTFLAAIFFFFFAGIEVQ